MTIIGNKILFINNWMIIEVIDNLYHGRIYSENTLSDNDGVTRSVCILEQCHTDIVETNNIVKIVDKHG